MSKYRRLVVYLLLSMPNATSFAEPSQDCGRLLSGPFDRYTIYVFCPSLLDLSREQAREVIVSAVDTSTPRVSGDVRILFFADESVLHRKSWPANQDRLIDSWGEAFLGAYHTQSSLLTVRSKDSDKWRNIHLLIE